MEGEPPAICSACGGKLGHPDDEIAHPDDDNPPENPHFKIQVRSDGEERMQCTKNGQLAKVIPPNDDEHPSNSGGPVGEGEGGGREPTQNQDPQGGRSGQGVFEFPEEKDQMDILSDVITNPRYELDDDQINEVKDWAEDYDGQLPPDVLGDLLKNMKGVQKQTADLLKQKYELKVSRWIRHQSERDDGPPIGALSGHRARHSASKPRPKRSPPTPPSNKKKGNQKQQPQPSGGGKQQPSRPKKKSREPLTRRRKRRRVERRNDAADIAMEQMAQEAAPEIARELTANFGTYFGLPGKVIEAKIEKDPDWAFEVADRLDVDLLGLLEPSEERKEELEEESASKVDAELDNALDNISSDEPITGTPGDHPMSESPEQEHQPNSHPRKEPRETTKSGTSLQEGGDSPEPSDHDMGSDDGDEAFEEIFGEGE